MSSNVALEIERVVESLSTKLALVLLVRTVIASMTVEHSQVFEGLATDLAAQGFLRCFTRLSFNLRKTSWEMLVETWATAVSVSVRVSLKVILKRECKRI